MLMALGAERMATLRAGRYNYGHEQRIDLLDPLSVRYFTRAFGCTERELREAVAAWGPEKVSVRRCFRRRAMKARRAA
jgi:hypothetical protein